MFKEGDIVIFNNGDSGVMKILQRSSLSIQGTVKVNFIDDHIFANNGMCYLIKEKNIVKDVSYERRKKLKKIKECLKKVM